MTGVEAPGFVLVVGCQRSGTTLLGQMLGAHPEAILVDEDEGAYDVVSALVDDADPVVVLRSVLPRALGKYADGREGRAPRHVVLKAPNATFFADALARSSRRMRFVFAARDVREVVHSMLGLREVPMIENQRRRLAAVPGLAARFAAELALLADPDVGSHTKAAIVWRVKTGLYRDFLAPPLSALLVPYDQLVQAPGDWLVKMQAHAGMTASGDRHDEVMKGVAIGRTDRTRVVDRQSRGRWVASLAGDQLEDIRRVAAGLMAELAMPW